MMTVVSDQDPKATMAVKSSCSLPAAGHFGPPMGLLDETSPSRFIGFS
jgi:hypothetical protein